MIVAFFPLPLLSGCADLYVTTYHDIGTWVVKDAFIYISCTGDMFGTVFETNAITTSTGHYTMDLMELGANPLELVYTCQVTNIMDGCLGCSKYNRCGDLY